MGQAKAAQRGKRIWLWVDVAFCAMIALVAFFMLYFIWMELTGLLDDALFMPLLFLVVLLVWLGFPLAFSQTGSVLTVWRLFGKRKIDMAQLDSMGATSHRLSNGVKIHMRGRLEELYLTHHKNMMRSDPQRQALEQAITTARPDKAWMRETSSSPLFKHCLLHILPDADWVSNQLLPITPAVDRREALFPCLLIILAVLLLALCALLPLVMIADGWLFIVWSINPALIALYGIFRLIGFWRIWRNRIIFEEAGLQTRKGLLHYRDIEGVEADPKAIRLSLKDGRILTLAQPPCRLPAPILAAMICAFVELHQKNKPA